jgi:hypothetical protein
MEEWRSVVGFEGLYEVNNYGRVRHKLYRPVAVEQRKARATICGGSPNSRLSAG